MANPNEESLLLEMVPLKDQLDRNPYAVVAAAVGVGFVLGGGLFTRLTGRIVGAAFRVGLAAALPYAQEELLAMATRSFQRDDDPGQSATVNGKIANATTSPDPSDRKTQPR